jgi:hypothetical protein
LKTTLLKIAAAAAGIVLALCIVAGSVLRYMSRPKPAKTWNETAIVADNAPEFDSSGENAPAISLYYEVVNATDSDYSIETTQQVKILAVLGDGSLAGPIADKAVVRTPVFLPAHRLGNIQLDLKTFHPPERSQSESGEAYRERLRQSMNEQMGNVYGFVVFDDVNHYQINLKRWATTKPQKRAESGTDQKNP